MNKEGSDEVGGGVEASEESTFSADMTPGFPEAVALSKDVAPGIPETVTLCEDGAPGTEKTLHLGDEKKQKNVARMWLAIGLLGIIAIFAGVGVWAFVFRSDFSGENLKELAVFISPFMALISAAFGFYFGISEK